jgi:hypothetical protein
MDIDETFIGAVTEIPAFVPQRKDIETQLIEVSWKARAGKDSFFAAYAVRGFQKASFAAELKRRVRQDFNLTEAHTDGDLKEQKLDSLNGHSPRELMIAYGNLFRQFNPNYWCETLLDSLDQWPGKYIITDVRYENEAECIKQRGGILLRLERHPSRDHMVDEKTKQSVSETALDNYKGFDLTLAAHGNKDLSDLEEFADVVARYIAAR